jgi:hypothetical protein
MITQGAVRGTGGALAAGSRAAAGSGAAAGVRAAARTGEAAGLRGALGLRAGAVVFTDVYGGFAKEGGRVGSGALGAGTGGVARCV